MNARYTAGFHILQATEYRAAAEMLSAIGRRREALPLLAAADRHERHAKRASSGDQGADVIVPEVPTKQNGLAIDCPHCGSKTDFEPADPEVGLKHATVACECGYWARVMKEDE